MCGMWDVPDVGCSGCSMLGIWDTQDGGVRNVGYLDCRYSGGGMFRIWDVWNAGCLQWVMFSICDGWDV